MAERIRIVDIAEELGLSTATVSNVIHGKTKKISDETVKRVQQLLEEKQYIPSMAGILLAQNDSRIVGVVINDHEKYEGRVLEDAFVASSLNALSRELEAAGYFMMVKTTAQWSEIIRFASMWNMEGLALIGFCAQDYRKLRESMRIPFVVYDGYFQETERICNLTIDHYDGGRQVGEYLWRMGHRSVLCAADNNWCMDKERMDGCRAGLEAAAKRSGETSGEPMPRNAGDSARTSEETMPRNAGDSAGSSEEPMPRNAGDSAGKSVENTPRDMKDSVGNIRTGFLQLPFEKEARRAFYEAHLPEILSYTAVFAASDYYAIELMHFLQEKGVKVPEDISIVGFDDSPWCEKVYPALTTVKQDAAERAREAVRILGDLKAGKYETKSVKLAVRLVERDSVRRKKEVNS